MDTIRECSQNVAEKVRFVLVYLCTAEFFGAVLHRCIAPLTAAEGCKKAPQCRAMRL
jgi:hypothetical protein